MTLMKDLVTPDGRKGEIHCRDGRPIDAQAGRLRGQDAFFRLLSWSEGTFAVELAPVRREEAIALDTAALLAEGMRRLDEWTRLLQELPPLDTLFVVDFRRLAERIGELPDEISDLLRLFEGAGREDVPRLVEELVAAGRKIYEARVLTSTLEDTYLEAVGGESS